MTCKKHGCDHRNSHRLTQTTQPEMFSFCCTQQHSKSTEHNQIKKKDLKKSQYDSKNIQHNVTSLKQLALATQRSYGLKYEGV